MDFLLLYGSEIFIKFRMYLPGKDKRSCSSLAQEAPKRLLSMPLSLTHSGSCSGFPLPLYKSA